MIGVASTFTTTWVPVGSSTAHEMGVFELKPISCTTVLSPGGSGIRSTPRPLIELLQREAGVNPARRVVPLFETARDLEAGKGVAATSAVPVYLRNEVVHKR